MSEPLYDFAELRLSAKPAVILLILLGIILVAISDTLPNPLQIGLFAQLFFGAAAGTWLLSRTRPWLGCAFAVASLTVLAYLACGPMAIPGALPLLVLPPLLAMTMIGTAAATATALGETLLWAFLPGHLPGTTWATLLIPWLTLWSAFFLLFSTQRSFYQVGQWLWEYYQRFRDALEEARNRKAELHQTLDDLAHANRQLALVNERLTMLRAVAEDAQRTKSAFLAKVSHEFRTPLNMIIGLIDLLVETPEIYGDRLPDALLEDLSIVHRNCTHLAAMINDVLDLSQAEAGKLILRREYVDLGQLITEALEVVRPLLEKKGLSQKVEVSDASLRVYCDRTRIRQVIVNLLSNAARFTERGGITVRLEKQAQQVIVSVGDTGPGIAPEDLKRIFEPFCQGSESQWRDKGGSGLGLSISKQFIELHGGRIWIESQRGLGTTVFFSLPVSLPAGPVAGPGRWLKEEWVWVERTSRAKIPELPSQPRLVLCDTTGELSPVLARSAEEMELVDAHDLAQTLQALEKAPAHAVLCNAASPDDLLRLLEQAKARIADTPIIGCAVPPLASSALPAGVAGYLVKPVARTALASAIKDLGRPVRRILLVDDDPDVLQLWARMLHAGDPSLEILSATSGPQALELLRARRPDLLLLDIVMPEMDGWQVLEAKNRDAALQPIPVILVSAQDRPEGPRLSQVLMATMGGGLALTKVLACSLDLAKELLKPD